MPSAPGKYDDVCTLARVAANARGAVLMIFEGKEGSGFSVQIDQRLIKSIPGLLREMADKIEESDRETPTGN